MPESAEIAKVEVAGPGFINFYLNAAANNAILDDARKEGMDFAKSNVGQGLKTQVEFVSANPVGPMHVGHGRWAALGDSLCRVMSHAGYDIQREFYINDHGSQMDVFGNSISYRYMQLIEIMEKEGLDIDGARREFYINDHGSQMDVFGNSISYRYMQLIEIMEKEGLDIDGARDFLAQDRDNFVQDEADEHLDSHPYMDAFTEGLGGNAYGGTYIIDEAAAFYKKDGDKWAQDEADEHLDSHPYMDAFTEGLGGNAYGGTYIIDEAAAFYKKDGDKWAHVTDEERMLYFREEGYAKMVENMRQLCHDVRCDFDKWFSERTVYIKDTEGEHAGTSAVDRAFAKLDEMGYLYNKDGALWFRSTDLGDDKDRVLVKANGEYTYFASDVAYHWDKFQRVDHVIDIWGCDHHGYINRVRCVCDALGYPGQFEVLLGQFVNLLRNGKPIRMPFHRSGRRQGPCSGEGQW